MSDREWSWGTVRGTLSAISALAVGTFAACLAWITGGAGALLFVVPCAVASVAFSLWRQARRSPSPISEVPPGGPARQRRREGWAIARGVVLAFVLWNTVTFVRYVGHDNGETLSQRMTTWGRDHGLGATIDFLETKAYSTPPSKTPASGLAVAVGTTSPDATGPATTTPANVSTPTGVNGSQPADTTTTVDAGAVAPAPLAPLFSPPLAGEGAWHAVAQTDGHDAIWVTGIRPLKSAGGVVGTVVAIDQTHLRAGLFNGSEEPGGTWRRGDRVPDALQPALLAAMNGGFRLEHIKGGYVTEGKVVKPLREGDATLAIGKDGKVVIGQLGRDLKDDGSWLSLRQNLTLIVDGGVSKVAEGIRNGVWWGADYGQKVYVVRSGACVLRDGHLAYALIGKVNAEQFAQSLIAIGCVKAMQLDINGTWPNFDYFTHDASGAITPHLVDSRMGNHLQRYLHGSTKEFIAFFDVGLVPKKSVLDT
jgi:hypothetical protein